MLKTIQNHLAKNRPSDLSFSQKFLLDNYHSLLTRFNAEQIDLDDTTGLPVEAIDKYATNASLLSNLLGKEELGTIPREHKGESLQ